jgi:hypothetical protein
VKYLLFFIWNHPRTYDFKRKETKILCSSVGVFKAQIQL